uniref:Uncharacterized protein n=1 Tax=Anguilla anguilla TaxID=7936 RepID=A0A0E9WNC0_ANGAN
MVILETSRYYYSLSNVCNVKRLFTSSLEQVVSTDYKSVHARPVAQSTTLECWCVLTYVNNESQFIKPQPWPMYSWRVTSPHYIHITK